jgi:hypothetical protein
LRFILYLFTALAIIPTCIFCSESDAQVWKVGPRQWTIQEESNYSEWVVANINVDFFIRHEIPVDCADVVYAVRWIYARIFHLPAAVTISENRLIGHWSENWKNIPTSTNWEKDRRFRAALLYMLKWTSTRSLPFDTYPIRIAADSVTPGTIFLAGGEHAGIVSYLVMNGSTTSPIQTLEAGMPSRIQKLFRRNLILPDPSFDNISGLFKYRWLSKKNNRWQHIPQQEQPFYSEEQYSGAFTRGYPNYLEAVAKRIDPKTYPPNEKAEQIIGTITRRLNERIIPVLEGNSKCHEMKCPEGSRAWELYSTPGRDEYTEVMIRYLEDIIRENHLDRNVILEKMAQIPLEISDSQVITLQYVFENYKWLSSDPEDSFEARWGLDKCNMIADRLKRAQESIDFIEKEYGKTDPDFSERSIMAQQNIVDELAKENRKSNCARDAYPH